MIEASIAKVPAANSVAAPPTRSGVESYVAGLQAKLSISEGQTEALEAFADALSANGRRMQDGGTCGDEPFGSLADRLAALASMRRGAEQLFAALDPSQRRIAVRILPLCCVPPIVAFV
jgi:hypothetical protein